MGQMLVHTVLKNDKVRLAAALERPGHDWVGQDIGIAMGGIELGVMVTDDTLDAMKQAQAVIDFTAPEATLALSNPHPNIGSSDQCS